VTTLYGECVVADIVYTMRRLFNLAGVPYPNLPDIKLPEFGIFWFPGLSNPTRPPQKPVRGILYFNAKDANVQLIAKLDTKNNSGTVTQSKLTYSQNILHLWSGGTSVVRTLGNAVSKLSITRDSLLIATSEAIRRFLDQFVQLYSTQAVPLLNCD